MEYIETIIWKGTSEYKKIIKNCGSSNIYPMAFIIIRHKKDIFTAIEWAITHRFKFKIKSEKNNFENNLNFYKDCLIIDIQKLNKLVFYDNNTIQIGAGVRIGDLANVVAKKGYMIPFGNNYDERSSFMLGGGIGLMQGYLGLMCDRIKSIDMIIFDKNKKGHLLKIDDTHYKNLFWACKGAGSGNFGIVIGYTLKLNIAPKIATTIKITWKFGAMKKILFAWQKFISTTHMTTSLQILNKSADAITLKGIWLGNQQEAINIIKSMLICEYVLETNEVSFDKAVDSTLLKCAKSNNSYNKKTSSSFMRRFFTSTDVDTLKEFLKKTSGESEIYMLSWNGKITKNKSNFSAFYWRSALCYIEWSVKWESVSNDDIDIINPDNNIIQVEKMRHKLRRSIVGSFLNVSV